MLPCTARGNWQVDRTLTHVPNSPDACKLSRDPSGAGLSLCGQEDLLKATVKGSCDLTLISPAEPGSL